MLERGFAVTTLEAIAPRRFALALAVVFACLPAPTAFANAKADISDVLTNVPGSTDHRYGATDTTGNGMSSLKIISSPTGGYVGVYHSLSNGSESVRVAISGDLLTWTLPRVLDVRSSHPSIAAAPDGFVVAYQKQDGCSGGGNCLYFRHYPSFSALLAAASDRQFRVRRTLSSCVEGSPNINSVTATSISVGFHYLVNCGSARQARGTLTNWSAWSAAPDANLNGLFQSLGTVHGKLRNRDSGNLEGRSFGVYAAQLASTDVSSWRPFLYDAQPNQLSQLSVRTHGGSKSFTNPTFTVLTGPHRLPAVVATYYVQSQGAAGHEAGELIFYREFPVIAAAGDIACPSSTPGSAGCHHQATSDLLAGSNAILPLGDNQYESGLLSAYSSFYSPSWGRFKQSTFPVPGNHEYHSSGAAGYFDYFNGIGSSTGPAGVRGRGYYSFDIGRWHLIALNSNCGSIDPGSAADGCATGSPQEQWLRADLAAHPNQCTLAYWHHPRFSSGTTHGDHPQVAAFWDALYSAHAEAVLSAHEHNYERFKQQRPDGTADPGYGLRQFVVGTGGRSHYAFATAEPNSLVRSSDTFGVLKLTLYPSAYDWKFVPETGKTFTDEGVGAQCR